MPSARSQAWMLLLGIALGFGLAVALGHVAARRSAPDNFKRFHQGISPDTLFYPPFAMMEKLALDRWRPGKVIVLVGGNSIFNGVGQPPDQLWSSHLQRLLGDDYVVTNLAFRGSFAAEGAALVAESLLRRGYPVLFVVNSSPGAGPGRATFGSYGYFYWQASAQGALLPYPPREVDLADYERHDPRASGDRIPEERLAGRLERYLRFASLWHDVAYRHVFTVWNSVTRDHPWQRRELYVDTEVSELSADRFQSDLEREMAIVRGFSRSLAGRDPQGLWHLTDRAQAVIPKMVNRAFPAELRARMLMVLSQNAPYYRNRLESWERDRDEAAFAGTARAWEALGIATIVAGDQFEVMDFFDRTHLAPNGGRKLAELVAPRIRELRTSLP